MTGVIVFGLVACVIIGFIWGLLSPGGDDDDDDSRGTFVWID